VQTGGRHHGERHTNHAAEEEPQAERSRRPRRTQSNTREELCSLGFWSRGPGRWNMHDRFDKFIERARKVLTLALGGGPAVQP